MSAESIIVVTVDIPNPEWTTPDTDGFTAHEINQTISYASEFPFGIQTLSVNGVNGGTDVRGLLYTPDLNSDDPCVNASAPYLPANVTRQANLPKGYPLVGIAPWVSGSCALSYMTAARADPIHALLFYLPGDSLLTPPDANSPTWATPDGGKWMSENPYPVYTIPSQYGVNLTYQSVLYSGNMTTVPYGHELTTIYDSMDYVRLFVDISIGNSSNLPSLWIFLLIVLAILLVIIGLTSLSMHWLQRRRRDNLRRRVADGEVDLEALGIKRLTVPQDVLDRMPTYTYGSGQSSDQPKHTDVTIEEKSRNAGNEIASITTIRPSPALLRNSSYRPTPLSQPTCAICLDDFVLAGSDTEGTTVRELPCHHIFHPECVDTFLRDSSSLCPMCKKTALPRGYCPATITNAMVRRERVVRRLRERVMSNPEATDMSLHEDRDLIGHLSRFGIRTAAGFSHFRASRRLSSEPIISSQQMHELGSEAPPHAILTTNEDAVEVPAVQPEQPRVQPPSTPGRREWARRRAEAMLGPRAPADPEAEESHRTSGWRKAVRSVFPRQ